jgi:hypothetical protein
MLMVYAVHRLLPTPKIGFMTLPISSRGAFVVAAVVRKQASVYLVHYIDVHFYILHGSIRRVLRYACLLPHLGIL